MLVAMATTRHVPITNLVHHAEWLDAELPLAQAQVEFVRRGRNFLGVVSGGLFVGVAVGHQISQMLGSQFGHALFGRNPVRNHVTFDALVATPETPLTELLKLASGRSDTFFFEDIAVVTAEGVFVGMIPMHRVARLQTSLLLENIAEVENQRQELAGRNRQMEDDLRMAREVQLAILPVVSVRLGHGRQVVTTQHFYQPSDLIGGDFFAVFQPSATTLGLLVCDVMGHGVRSALITTIISALVHEAQPAHLDPGRMLTSLNQNLQKILQSVGATIFVTAAYAVIDLTKNAVAYGQAGHPPGFLWCAADGKSAPLLLSPEEEGPALGLFDDMVYATKRFAMGTGDALMLFTDGVVEAATVSGDEFGTERLRLAFDRALESDTPDVAAAVAEAARTHAAGNRFADDVCVVIARLQAHVVPAGDAGPVIGNYAAAPRH
jgi:sigma-B regulation protein RsbU (phosphoserine phosphatase)